MKAMVCNNCGSSEFKRQGVNYLCAYCGSVFRVNGITAESYILNARRALKTGDYEQAEKYYSVLELYLPYSIEAIFFSNFCKLKTEIVESEDYSVFSSADVLINSLPLIEENFTEEDYEILKEISSNILSLKNLNPLNFELKTKIIKLNHEFVFVLLSCAKSLDENKQKGLYLCALNHILYIMRLNTNPSQYNPLLKTVVGKIQEIDPSFSFSFPEEEIKEPAASPSAPAPKFPSVILALMSIFIAAVGCVLYSGEIFQCIMGIFFNIVALGIVNVGLKFNKSLKILRSFITVALIIGFVILMAALALTFTN